MARKAVEEPKEVRASAVVRAELDSVIHQIFDVARAIGQAVNTEGSHAPKVQAIAKFASAIPQLATDEQGLRLEWNEALAAEEEARKKAAAV